MPNRQIPRQYRPADWYWAVAGNATHVYGSARDSIVPITDAQYLAWLAINERPTRINNQQDLDAVLLPHRADEQARQYAKLRALAGMTPAEVKAWVDGNVTTFADAKDAIKTLAIAVSVLARRL